MRVAAANVFVLAAACVATASGWSIMEELLEAPQMVDVFRPNALTPCNCTNGTMDCSRRGKVMLEYDDVCSGPVTTLNLFDNEFSALPDGFLQATVVNVSKNRLTALPHSSQFSPGIKVLDLSGNSITNSSDELFHLEYLEKLVVSRNCELETLEFLPDPCALKHLEAVKIRLRNIQDSLMRCALLETLDLSENYLSKLPENAFSELSHLQVLNLAANPLETLPARIFENVTELRVLDLRSTGLQTLPSNVFDTLSNLEVLNLKGNKMKYLTPGIFSSLTHLKELNLIRIPFEMYPPALANLYSLEKLHLFFADFSSLPENAFASLPKLKEINLAHNKLSSLPRNIFSGLSNLHTVTLGENPIHWIPENLFSDSPNLKYIWMPCVELNAEDVRVIENASHIIIGGCRNMELRAEVFSELSRAELLIINGNNIVSISEDAFVGLSELHTLDISENGLTSLPKGIFSPLSDLRNLYMFNNRFTAIREGLFFGLNNLTSLSLKANRLTELHENSFEDVPSLERLDLSINSLTIIPPNLFTCLPFLREVNLEYNRLSALPPYNPSWASVRVVSFSFNNLPLDEEALLAWLEAETAPGSETQDLAILLREDEGCVLQPAALSRLTRAGVALMTCGQHRPRCVLARRGHVLVELTVCGAGLPLLPTRLQ